MEFENCTFKIQPTGRKLNVFREKFFLFSSITRKVLSFQYFWESIKMLLKSKNDEQKNGWSCSEQAK